MKAVCPKDPTHNRFYTVAHVMEEWRVDEHGNFIEKVETLQTTHSPDAGNNWTCAACGALAKVEG